MDRARLIIIEQGQSRLKSLELTRLRGRRLKGKGKGVLGAREVRASRAPRVSLAPKTPFPFPFKRLPRRLGVDEHRTSSTLSQSDHTYAEAV